MKKLLLTAICVVALSNFQVMAQGYTALWKQVRDAQSKDLPKTELEVLGKIADKARADHNYGHLLKAQLRRTAVQTQIAPDSIDVELERVKNAMEQAEKSGNRVLAAVYQSVLGRIYRDKSSSFGYRGASDELESATNKALSKEFYAKSLEPVELLAKQSAKGYEPALVDGIDSHIFGGDLLHVLGIEAGDYKTLHNWYLACGNRPAACICALNDLGSSDHSSSIRKSAYLLALDSLINEYQDLKECGELAIARYHFMEQAEDASAEEKMNCINYALQHWGSWPRMNILRNAQNHLTLPSFSVSVGDGIQLPNKSRKVEIRQLVNCQQLTMTVQRVNVDGDTNLNPQNSQDYAKLKKLIVNDGTQQTVTRRYVGQPDYKVIEDSMTIAGLPVGVYLVEFSTERANMRTERMLLHVSDLYVIHEPLPDSRIRFVVVNATTGRPVPGAQIRISNRANSNGKDGSTTLTTDAKGEKIFDFLQVRPRTYFVFTDKDKSSPEQSVSTYYSFYDNQTTQYTYNVLTDRSLYRPGQTVHAAVIAYKTERHTETSALAGEQVTLTLRNANHEVVEEKKVTTDDYGKASADFVLPSTGLTGQFSISTKRGSTYFSVEEYKRPTFRVEFDEVTEKYESGDEVTVKGHVRSFAGVPVQGARVKYKVVRRRAMWWWRGDNEGDKTLVEDTLVTNDDGSFEVMVPMVMDDNRRTKNERISRFYNFVVEADATDTAGESHHGSTSLPLGDKATAFSVTMPAKIEADSIAKVTFHYLNNAGKPIDAKVSYILKDETSKIKENKTVAANEAFEMRFNTLKSGLYTLEATCGDDTLKQEIIVFSMKDKQPAVKTHDWFYTSASEFPRDGRPIYIQMGASDKDQHIVYSIFSGNKVLESGVIDQSNAITTRQFTYKDEYGDGALLTCAWVREGKLYTHQAELRRPLPDKRLKLSWKTFRDRLTPGQKEEWTLHVSHPSSLIAVLFDRSLDDIRRHSWSFGPNIWRSLPSTQWIGRRERDFSLYGEQPYKSLAENELRFTHFDPEMFDFVPRVAFNYNSRAGGFRIRGTAPMMAKATANVEESSDMLREVPLMSVKQKNSAMTDAIAARDVAGNDDSEAQKSTSESTQVRENLNETAFFYPSLMTDKNGDVSLKFTLPESITTWRFLGLATDKDVRFGMLEGEVVAKKDVMIQPNMPRFLRSGDKGQIAARIFNTGEKNVKGTATIELLEPETEKVVYSQNTPFSVETGKTAAVSFDVDAASDAIAGHSLLICRVLASGNGFSDGEQHYLPILPDYELVINTVPFTQHGAGTKTIDLTKLFGSSDNTRLSANSQLSTLNSQLSSLTVEYTNNPAWMMIQTLPTVATSLEKNAISQAAAYYANSLADHLLKQSPNIKTTIELWKREQTAETSLMSSLEKNQELKTMVLDETPWVAEAHHESDQKRLLSNYFDENTLRYRLDNNLSNLQKLQNGDGSWSWWQGMSGSLHMTVAVSKMLVRLNTMLDPSSNTQHPSPNTQHAEMLDKAYVFMGHQILKEVEEMKKMEKKGAKNVRPSETAIDWLYLTTLDGRKLSDRVQEAKTYLINRLSKQTRDFTIYGKAVSAIILGKNGHEKMAKDYLKSIREYSVFTEEMGRYFDTRKAGYSWFDYKIPTEVAAIEAIRLLQPQDTQTVEEMQRWLLQEKRTQQWSTPINAVNAVYAFMGDEMSEKLTPMNAQLSVLKVDGREIETLQATAGLGYVKSTQEGRNFKTFTAEKTSDGTSWGAIYTRSFQPVSEIADASSGLKVKREVFVISRSSGVQEDSRSSLLVSPSSLKVGDRVKVRITIEAERDYDFVQVSDKRAACLEPVGQLSGYRWGYYCAPRDNVTNYYFDRMAKGRHIVETEYYVDRTGRYQTGTCTVQCAYSPEYTARTAAEWFEVK